MSHAPTPSPRRILIVEDDPAILHGLAHNLAYEGYEVITAMDGERGLHLALEKSPHLLILDVMLPGMNGYELLERLRSQREVPVLMLSAKGAEEDKVLGLELGADDYVTKPFGVPEILARIKAILRRHSGEPTREVRFGALCFHPETQSVERGGELVDLTPQEIRLLAFFLEREGRTLSRDSILDGAWGTSYVGTTRTVDNFVRSLRVKLEVDPENPRHFVTARGFGYRFEK